MKQDSQECKAAATFECVYLASLIFVKLSIGFALLRITTHRSIRHFLYFIMTLSSISGFICMVAILSMCQPLSATWTGMGKCAPPSVLKCVAIYLTVSACITDFSCSILPFFILWNLRMARRLKFTLAVVLSLGFLASAATVVRACYFDRFLARVDYVWGFSDLALWSVIEGLIGITIGSVPSLKPMFKRFKFLAITSSHRSNSKKASDYQHFDSYAMQSRNKGKNQTRVITVAEESDSVKELVTGANIVVSQEFRHEEEYEYHDRKPASSV
ncbi:hypothetical protein D6D18_02816 [Aureobasidium pullulans]|nr:hypothetical protein D6D18_02816 [Aureobasidium pullulans]